MITANENEIGQIFQNLVGNALKFRAKDRPPHIHISAKPDRNNWLFSVADNGIGIEQEYSERIFQMFQRLHDRETYEGSGIGLSIAKKIVERHGGRIWFESEPDNGTTFYFTLPGRQEEKAEKAA
jgi:signal transduction histidine kinase